MDVRRVDSGTGVFDLGATPVHLPSRVGPDVPIVALVGFQHDEASFAAYVSRYCSDAEPGRLVMTAASESNWPNWECHPAGDELVVILRGKGTFVQEIDGEDRRTSFGPGTAIVNPAGVWHTADVEEPMHALYITPCPGTRHRPRQS